MAEIHHKSLVICLFHSSGISTEWALTMVGHICLNPPAIVVCSCFLLTSPNPNLNICSKFRSESGKNTCVTRNNSSDGFSLLLAWLHRSYTVPSIYTWVKPRSAQFQKRTVDWWLWGCTTCFYHLLSNKLEIAIVNHRPHPPTIIKELPVVWHCLTLPWHSILLGNHSTSFNTMHKKCQV